MTAESPDENDNGTRPRSRRLLRPLAAVCGLIAVLAITTGIVVLQLEPELLPGISVESAEHRPDMVASTPIVPTATIDVTTPAQPSGPATITVAAVGDMIFDRRVKTLMGATSGSEPLSTVAEHLAAVDIALGNLESPLSNRGTRDTGKSVTFRGDPLAIEGLALAGFDFLSLANNHVLDYGSDALADTLLLLDGAGIGHAGAGMDRTEAWTPSVADIDGTTVAFLSFSDILPPGFVADDTHPGLAQSRYNMDSVEEAIRSAKSEYDYVIVSFHWGIEYVDDCNAEQVAGAHRAVDAGADMVMSHHPHVIQAVEYYNGRLIAYSLGDFVFDHYSRKTGEAFILDASLGPAGVSEVVITPVYLDTNGKPEYVHGTEASVILERLQYISAKRGTTIAIDGDVARVTP